MVDHPRTPQPRPAQPPAPSPAAPPPVSPLPPAPPRPAAPVPTPAKQPAPQPAGPPQAPAPRPDREPQKVGAADVGPIPPGILPGDVSPAEVPQPSEFRDQVPAKSDDRINVGDPREAMARLGQARPLRSLDPSRQPPPPRGGKELKKGETYWIVNAEDLDQPCKGKVVRLTKTPGKYVGVELEKPVGPHIVHDCDGAGKLGRCLYCRVDQVLTDDEYRVYLERHKLVYAPQPPLEDLDVLRLDVAPDGRHEIR
jgi:hypothetical protein